MLRALLVDDEIAALRSLELLLREYCPDVEIVATARSGNEAIDLVATHSPDLVFLDVEMPKGNGFDFLEQSPNLNFEVIFVTAYNQYAIKAFKYSAIDYVLKPIDIEELVAAVAKVKEQRASKVNSYSRYHALFDNLRELIPQKMVIPEGDSFSCINLNEVLSVSNLNDQFVFSLASGKELTIPSKSISIDAITDSISFVEICPHTWVNLGHIKRIERLGKGEAIMSTGMRIPLEGGAKELLIDRLTQYSRRSSV